MPGKIGACWLVLVMCCAKKYNSFDLSLRDDAEDGLRMSSGRQRRPPDSGERLLCRFLILFGMIVIHVALNNDRLVRIGDQSCLAISAALLGAHPILARLADLRTNV